MKQLLITIAAVVLVGCGPQPPDISIHQAAEDGNIEAVKQHLASGTLVNAVNKYDETPLMISVIFDQMETLEFLISNNADVNLKNKDGESPLHVAGGAKKELIEFLISNGADLNIKDKYDRTPLDLMEKRGQFESARILRKHGCKNGSIQSAADGGDTEAVKDFLEGGIDVNANSKLGTALHRAVLRGHMDIVDLLINNGANVNLKSESGDTALHYAAKKNHIDIVEMLLKNGADINITGYRGLVPLHFAVTFDSVQLSEKLIIHGADVNVPNDDGQTPLDVVGYNEMQLLTGGPQFIPSGIALGNEKPVEKDKSQMVAILRKHGGKTGQELKAEGK